MPKWCAQPSGGAADDRCSTPVDAARTRHGPPAAVRTGAGRPAASPSTAARSAPGDLFVALKGPNFDGHDFVADALAKGAAAAMVARPPAGFADDAPLLLVADTFAALRELGRGRPRPCRCPRRRHHRQRRQDRHQGGAAPGAGPAGADARQRRQPQQPLGRAAQPRPHAGTAAFARVRDRHEPCGRDRAADARWSGRMSP